MKGIITWFVDNVVAANLLMFILLSGGIMSLFTTHQEEFPNVDPDVVSITVPYLGASPEEVERGVCIRIEEAIESIQGIDKVNTTASEGVCSVAVEVADGFDSASVACLLYHKKYKFQKYDMQIVQRRLKQTYQSLH